MSVTPELGLVCITASKEVRYRTVTRKRLLSFPELEQEELLRNLYKDNLERLNLAIDFCLNNKLKLYRISSNLFPFADTEMGEKVLNELSEEL
ncbi:MAG: UV damage endonuclease UvsE, partial [Microcoleus sp. SIO2G3]|nr:UV damage endonuclease UvsE [Microcoleus sp. SIO2G3]